MKNYLSDVRFLCPDESGLDRLLQSSSAEPFAENAIAFLHALSLALKNDPETRRYPDVATFAFFCRRANLIQLKRKYYTGKNPRLGRGVIFHITPANVPVTFAYSLVSGILAGNANIVKVSSKASSRADLICRVITRLVAEGEHAPVTSRLALVRYDPASEATAYFSSVCDVRVIWGGDATIAEIRKNSLPPRSFDVTFADRYSLCVINADKYVGEKSPERVAAGFYNDTYLSDQDACTSPHLIVWLGNDEHVATAKRIFWHHLHELAKARYTLQPHSAVNKLAIFYSQAVHLEGIRKTRMPDNLVWRTELTELPADIDKYRCSGGYFSEFKALSLSQLSTVISSKYQTLSYYGIEKPELIQFIAGIRPKGIDTIVPIGRTTDFSLTRDGYNLIDTLSREITIL